MSVPRESVRCRKRTRQQRCTDGSYRDPMSVMYEDVLRGAVRCRSRELVLKRELRILLDRLEFAKSLGPSDTFVECLNASVEFYTRVETMRVLLGAKP